MSTSWEQTILSLSSYKGKLVWQFHGVDRKIRSRDSGIGMKVKNMKGTGPVVTCSETTPAHMIADVSNGDVKYDIFYQE